MAQPNKVEVSFDQRSLRILQAATKNLEMLAQVTEQARRDFNEAMEKFQEALSEIHTEPTSPETLYNKDDTDPNI